MKQTTALDSVIAHEWLSSLIHRAIQIIFPSSKRASNFAYASSFLYIFIRFAFKTYMKDDFKYVWSPF